MKKLILMALTGLSLSAQAEYVNLECSNARTGATMSIKQKATRYIDTYVTVTTAEQQTIKYFGVTQSQAGELFKRTVIELIEDEGTLTINARPPVCGRRVCDDEDVGGLKYSAYLSVGEDETYFSCVLAK